MIHVCNSHGLLVNVLIRLRGKCKLLVEDLVKWSKRAADLTLV